MALSKSTLITRVRTRLNDNPFTTACTEAMDTTETGLDVASTTKFDVGDVVEFTDDGERCLVTALASATELTVIRNFDGSSGSAVGTGTSHAISTLINKNPVFSYRMIEDAISETIESYWPHVYKNVAVTVTPVSGTDWYELDEGSNVYNGIDLSTVVQIVNSKPFFYGTRRGAYPVQIYHNLPSASFGSTVAIYLPYKKDLTSNITVNALAKITDTVSGGNYSDLADDISGHTTMLFAVSKVIGWSGVSRATQEDVSMSDESIRPGVREMLAAEWEAKAIISRRKWEAELKVKYPRKPNLAGDGVV